MFYVMHRTRSTFSLYDATEEWIMGVWSFKPTLKKVDSKLIILKLNEQLNTFRSV